MKDITLKIIAKQYGEKGFEDNMEFVTEGQLYDKGNAIYILYDESALSGMDGSRTRLRLEGSKVKMSRSNEGLLDTVIEFEEGDKYEGYYNTPMGPLELEVVTNSLKNKITADGEGSLSIDYHISLKGLIEGRNKLDIQII